MKHNHDALDKMFDDARDLAASMRETRIVFVGDKITSPDDLDLIVKEDTRQRLAHAREKARRAAEYKYRNIVYTDYLSHLRELYSVAPSGAQRTKAQIKVLIEKQKPNLREQIFNEWPWETIRDLYVSRGV